MLFAVPRCVVNYHISAPWMVAEYLDAVSTLSVIFCLIPVEISTPVVLF